jgi:DNA adenine methylase
MNFLLVQPRGRRRAGRAAEPQEPEKPVPPPLKWAGGKRWLVPRLKEIWGPHRHRRLVEPLCGGLAVTLGLRPTRALLSDINPHPINFYKWVKKGLVITLRMKNDRDVFYEYRDRFNRLISGGKARSREAAELFYYLNRSCYNGLCRFNRGGYFNVPFGRYKTINYAPDFLDYRRILAEWTFRDGPFESVPVEPDDFIYADPPYDVEFTQYSRDGFTFEDQVRLARWLAGHPGPVVLSNQATPRILALYQRLGFEIETLEAPRLISCTGDRTPAREVLATRGL